MGIILIGLIEVSRCVHCGWRYSLGLDPGGYQWGERASHEKASLCFMTGCELPHAPAMTSLL